MQQELENVGLAKDQKLREQRAKALESDFLEDATAFQKELDTPYVQRSWAKSVAETRLQGDTRSAG